MSRSGLEGALDRLAENQRLDLVIKALERPCAKPRACNPVGTCESTTTNVKPLGTTQE